LKIYDFDGITELTSLAQDEIAQCICINGNWGIHNAAMGGTANLNDYYTKTQIDTNHYTKTVSDSRYLTSVDLNDYYTKSEINNLLDNITYAD